MHNFPDIALFRTLDCAAILNDLTGIAAPRDVYCRVTKKPDGFYGDLGICSNDVLVGLVETQFRFNGFFGVSQFRNAHLFDVSDRHSFQVNFRSGSQVIGVFEERDDRVFRSQETRLTANEENRHCQ